MNHRAHYLLQVLDKIGSPLLRAVHEVEVRRLGGATPDLAREAQKVAELLGKTVQTGLEALALIDLGPTGQITDTLRLSLTGIAGPLVASAYRNSGSAPADADIKRMVAALQAVTTFADNFEANSENTEALQRLDVAQDVAGHAAHGSAMAAVQHLAALLPLCEAVAAFSFGQPEKKAVMETGSRVHEFARALQHRLQTGPESLPGLLATLAELYASCHRSETIRIMSMNEQQRAEAQTAGALSLESVWRAFELRASVLEALVLSIVNSGGALSGGGGSGGGPASERSSAAPVPQAPPIPAAPPQTLPASPPVGNPMTFFKKPTDQV